MYRIALCDDDEKELDNTNKLLAVYKATRPEYDFVTLQFTSVEPLLAEVERGNHFDLLLLDIFLPGKTGMEGYRELQQKGFLCPVVFLTTSLTHAVSAFEVNAVQYLVKPVKETDFFFAMDKAFLCIAEERRRHIVLRINHKLRRITLRDILYCEAQNNHQLFRFTNGTEISVKMTLTELCEMVAGFPSFVRVGMAYLVNLAHIASLTAKEIHLDNGHVIWIPRGAYPALKERYFAFFCDRGGE